MRMRKIISLCIIVAAISIVGWTAVRRWSVTEHGLLDWRVALLLKASSLMQDNLIDPGISIRENREKIRMAASLTHSGTIELASVKDIKIPVKNANIGARVYTPTGARAPLPVILYFHGGGWVVGDLDSYDDVCRTLAQKALALVISVDYRLAPEHPFPTAAEDSYAALVWTAKYAASLGGDPERIALAGDSAGGNLAAVTSLISRDRRGPKIVKQVLIYPVTNLTAFDTASHKHFAKGFMLTRADIEWFRAQYLPNDKDRANPHASPLLAKSHAGLPPALVITARFDVLRDEGEAYAMKLKYAGVPTKLVRFDGLIHGFIIMGNFVPRAAEGLDLIGRELQEAFGGNAGAR